MSCSLRFLQRLSTVRVSMLSPQVSVGSSALPLHPEASRTQTHILVGAGG